MEKVKAYTAAFAGIYRTDTAVAIVFGAIHHHKKMFPEAKMLNIAVSVMETFSIRDVTPNALLTAYYRTEKSFLNNGGINE